MSYNLLNAIPNSIFNKIKNIRIKDEYELAGLTQEIVYNHFDYFSISNEPKDLGDKELVFQLENTDYLELAETIKGAL